MGPVEFFLNTKGRRPVLTCTRCGLSTPVGAEPGSVQDMKDQHVCGLASGEWAQFSMNTHPSMPLVSCSLCHRSILVASGRAAVAEKRAQHVCGPPDGAWS